MFKETKEIRRDLKNRYKSIEYTKVQTIKQTKVQTIE